MEMLAIEPNNYARVIQWMNGEVPEERDMNDEIDIMDFIPDIVEQLMDGRKEIHSQERQSEIIQELMPVLSKREKEYFILHVGQRKSMQKVSNELGISKSSVQEYVNRIRNKIQSL